MHKYFYSYKWFSLRSEGYGNGVAELDKPLDNIEAIRNLRDIVIEDVSTREHVNHPSVIILNFQKI